MELSIIIINILILLILFSGLGMTLIGLPGNAVIFCTTLAYAFYDNFVHIGIGELAFVLGAILVGELFETLTAAIWAKKEQASKLAIGVAVIGTIIGGILGTMIVPIIGSILGALVGGFASSYIAEYRTTKNGAQARRVALGVIKGQILGSIIKFSVAIAAILYVLIQMPW